MLGLDCNLGPEVEHLSWKMSGMLIWVWGKKVVHCHFFLDVDNFQEVHDMLCSIELGDWCVQSMFLFHFRPGWKRKSGK